MVLYARVTTKVTSGRLSSSKDGICTIFDSSSSSSRCNSNGSCSSNGISKIIIMISHNCERSFCFSNVKITLIEAVADSSNVPSQLSVHVCASFFVFHVPVCRLNCYHSIWRRHFIIYTGVRPRPVFVILYW